MSTKRKTYSAEFKANLVLEGAKTINEIASQYGVLYYPKKTKQHFKSSYFIYDKIRI